MCVYVHVCVRACVRAPCFHSFIHRGPKCVFLSQQDECYNYIKVLVPRNDETLFACGTNAFNPTCRNYKVSAAAAASLTDESDTVGACVVPLLWPQA